MDSHQSTHCLRPSPRTCRWLWTGIATIVIGLAISACSGVGAGSPPTNNPLGISESAALVYNPSDGSLLKASQDGLSRWRSDSGWQNVPTPQTSALSGVVVNPDQPTTLYVSGRGLGVVRSDDSGSNWRTVNTGLANQDVTALAVHSFRRETLFAWVNEDGVYRTEDGGASWEQMPDQGPPNKDVRGLVHSTLPGSMNTGWLYASTPTGAYLSMDCF